ncbi:MAG: hypothetical protein ACK4UK_00655 [Flavobacterium sp.]
MKRGRLSVIHGVIFNVLIVLSLNFSKGKYFPGDYIDDVDVGDKEVV